MRREQSYVNKYGPEVGPQLYHALQSQAAHAGVSARLRRKLDALSGRAPAPGPLPLFPGDQGESEDVGVGEKLPAPVAVGS